MVLLTALGPCFHSGELPYQVLGTSLLLGHVLGYRLAASAAAWLLPLTLLLPPLLAGLRGLNPELSMAARVLLGSCLAVLATAPLAHLTLRWWARLGTQPGGLARLYSLEMAGAALGLGLAVALGPRGLLLAFPSVVTVSLGLVEKRLWSLGVLALLGSLALVPLERWAQRRCYPGGKVLAAAYSPYQLVEVVEMQGQPQLFLNGLCHHNMADLKQLNYYLAELPAELLGSPEGKKALILGGGGFLSARETVRRGLPTTVVELDPRVAELSLRWIAGSSPPDYRVEVTDARQFTSQGESFDLIVFSLPYPYSLNVASLFTREYFTRLSENLKPGGIVTVFLGNPVRQGRLDRASAGFLRALRQAFPHAVGVSSGECDNTVVLATRESPLKVEDVYRRLKKDRRYQFSILDGPALDRLCAEVQAASLSNLQACWHLNLQLWGWR